MGSTTRIDIVQAGNAGFMIYGSFGNAAGCTVPDQVFVKSGHPQYELLYSTALAAFAAGKSLAAYAGGCEAVGWYSAPTTTYNTLDNTQSLFIRN